MRCQRIVKLLKIPAVAVSELIKHLCRSPVRSGSVSYRILYVRLVGTLCETCLRVIQIIHAVSVFVRAEYPVHQRFIGILRDQDTSCSVSSVLKSVQQQGIIAVYACVQFGIIGIE